MRVLLVEDDRKLADIVVRGMAAAGHDVEVAPTGERGIDMACAGGFDAVILDVMLPGIDGFETCRRLRRKGAWVPVLMLTARDSVEDRVEGLDAGSDDYLVKPFSFAELLARLRALARRGDARDADVVAVGDLACDLRSRRAFRGDAAIELSTREFDLLAAFVAAPGRVFERFELLDRVWGSDAEPSSNVVDQYVRYLRAKVDTPFGVRSIETVRGVGYRLREDGGRAA